MSPAHDSARFRMDRRAVEPHERCADGLAHPVDQPTSSFLLRFRRGYEQWCFSARSASLLAAVPS